jgi:hypothetical protein
MEIIDFYYDESDQVLDVTFTTDSDSDYYRKLQLTLRTIKFYSPTIIDEDDIIDCDEDFIIEILEEYFKKNDMPDEEVF